MLDVTDLVKTYPSEKGRGELVHAVDGVTLHVEEGELFTLLGPSGCGKSTTLRSIAGLERPDAGRLVVKDRVLFSSADRTNVPAHDRGLGMVFQSYAIWPHMTVKQNVAFPLRSRSRRKRPSREQIEERTQHALEMVELGDLGDRPATNLSGGQQQRLALARALVTDSPLLLLDEPLSNLDAKLRETMRFELRRMQRRFGITAIYVTHDQTEALGMSTRIAVMNHGKVMQVGEPREIYGSPANQFVADFIGSSNFLEGRIESRHPGQGYLVDVGPFSIWAGSAVELSPSSSVVVSVRPERVSISELGDGEIDARPGIVKGTVATLQFLGEAVDYIVDVGGLEVRARSNPAVDLPHGTDVVVTFDPEQARVVSAD